MGEDYIMSPKDLCTIEFIDKLIEAGIDSFKIEGRKRSPEYVATTVSLYRKAIDLYFEGKLTEEIKKQMLNDLEKVYNRGFSSGFYFDIPSAEDYADIYGSKATTRKVFVGTVVNYFKVPKILHVNLESEELNINDEILIIGSTTGVVSTKIKKILKDDIPIDKAIKGDSVTIPCEDLVRPRDRVYIIRHLNKN